MNKKLLLIMMPAMLAATLTGCKKDSKTTITVFAAASMTESLNEVIKAFKSENKGYEVKVNYDSSGKLLTQIEQGAVCDVFISASNKQIKSLDDAGKLLEDTRVDLLENKIALVVAPGNPKGINSFADLQTTLQGVLNDTVTGFILGLGEGAVDGKYSVPVREYSELIIEQYMGIQINDLKAKNAISEYSNVKGVTTAVAQSGVHAGLIYKTDAFSAGLTVAALATSTECSKKVIYPAAVLKATKVEEASKKFMEFIKGDVAKEKFEAVGFERA